MSLLISIINASDSNFETSKSFGPEGGTIGRGPDNSWILKDPERYLSARHCQISHENGQFFITDLSTNGTFHNGSANPIGKGAKEALNDGDTIVVGDYECNIKISAAENAPDPLAGQYLDPFADKNDFDSAPGFANDPFASAPKLADESLFSQSLSEMDPLAALDKAQGRYTDQQEFNPAHDPFAAPVGNDSFASAAAPASFSDQADPLNQQISWPDAAPEQPSAASSEIPDDWYDEPSEPAVADDVQPSMPLTSPPQVPKPSRGAANTASEVSVPESSISASQQELLASNARIQAELDALKKQLSSKAQNASNEISVDTSFVESLGLLDKNLSDEQVTRINHLAGDVMREMVRGLMQVLGSRGSVKNEFRMHVTTIQPVENNPIKFSANVDDALENMFVKEGNAYIEPVEAVQEGFESIAEHQVAILAGIKSAFKGVIERFDPGLLEERFARQNKGSFMPVSQKAKYWDSFIDYYNEMAGDLDNSFQYLFGDDFVKAYEEQLQKMSISRKARKNNKDK